MRAGRPYCLSHGGNAAAGRHAKTPGQRRHTVARYARPTPLRRAFSLFFFASSKKWERCFKGLVAPNRHIPRRGGNIAWLRRCAGQAPHKTGTWACLLFSRWGGKILRLPGPPSIRWANVRGRTWILKIKQFSEIEFSVHVPLHYFRLNNFFEIEAKNNEALNPVAC